MSIIELLLLAIGLSMDAFAVSVCIGLTSGKATVKKALITGLYFGIFQAGMPIIGYMAATLFADQIIAFDHWVAFGLLSILGIKMIVEGLRKGEVTETPDSNASEKDADISPRKMLPLAVSTSIDAMAVGISFAFLKVSLIPAVSVIGVMTFTLSIIGVKIGNVVGVKFKSKAEIAGGVILFLIGVKILFEHLTA